MKVFFVYTIVVLTFVIINNIVKEYYNQYLLIPPSVAIIFEFIILSIFYFTIIRKVQVKKLILFFGFLYCIFWIYNFSKSSFTDFDFIPVVIESSFFMLVILYFFYEIMHYNFATPILQLPNFWISAAFLIFFSGEIFVLLFSIKLFDKQGFNQQLLLIWGAMYIIKNILLCIAIFINRNLSTPKDNSLIPPNLNLDTFQPLNNQTNH